MTATWEDTMDALSRNRTDRSGRAPKYQPGMGMLERMIKHLYIRRFPQTEPVGATIEADSERPISRPREKKPASSKRR
jgi:hypothetical protein